MHFGKQFSVHAQQSFDHRLHAAVLIGGALTAALFALPPHAYGSTAVGPAATGTSILQRAQSGARSSAVSAPLAVPTLDNEQWNFLTLINNYRAQNGVGALQVSIALSNS